MKSKYKNLIKGFFSVNPQASCHVALPLGLIMVNMIYIITYKWLKFLCDKCNCNNATIDYFYLVQSWEVLLTTCCHACGCISVTISNWYLPVILNRERCTSRICCHFVFTAHSISHLSHAYLWVWWIQLCIPLSPLTDNALSHECNSQRSPFQASWSYHHRSCMTAWKHVNQEGKLLHLCGGFEKMTWKKTWICF